MRRPTRRPRVLLAALALALAVPVGLTAQDRAQAAPAPGTPQLTTSAGELTLTVPPSRTAPGYALHMTRDQLAFTTSRSGTTVLATAPGDAGALRFRTAGTWQHATRV
ncbi:glycosyl hydrolase family 31, partial [Streptomyces carpinensis]